MGFDSTAMALVSCPWPPIMTAKRIWMMWSGVWALAAWQWPPILSTKSVWLLWPHSRMLTLAISCVLSIVLWKALMNWSTDVVAGRSVHDGTADDWRQEFEAADDGKVEPDDTVQRFFALAHGHADAVAESRSEGVLGLAGTTFHWSE